MWNPKHSSESYVTERHDTTSRTALDFAAGAPSGSRMNFSMRVKSEHCFQQVADFCCTKVEIKVHRDTCGATQLLLGASELHYDKSRQRRFLRFDAMSWRSDSGTAAHTALAILNDIIHGVGIFITYMNSKLKQRERARRSCQRGKGPLTLNGFDDFYLFIYF